MMMVIHVYPVDPNLSVVSNVSKIQNKNTNSVLERSSLITRNTTTRRMSRFPWKAKEEPKIIRSCSPSLPLFAPSTLHHMAMFSPLPNFPHLIPHPFSTFPSSLSLFSFSFSLSLFPFSHFPFSPLFPIHIPTLFGLSHVTQVVVFEGWSVQNGMECVSFSLSLFLNETNIRSVWISVCECLLVRMMNHPNHVSLWLCIITILSLSLSSLFPPSLDLIVPLLKQCLKHSLHLFPFVSWPFFFFSLSSSPLYLNTISVSFPCLYFSFAALLSSHFFLCFLPSFVRFLLPSSLPFFLSLFSRVSHERESRGFCWSEHEKRTKEGTKPRKKNQGKERGERMEEKEGAGRERREREGEKREASRARENQDFAASLICSLALSASEQR